jgi:plastocyanin
MNRLRLTIAMLLALTVPLALAGCGGSTAQPATSATSTSTDAGGAATGGLTVSESGFAFEPASLDVKVGDTVTFTNKDSAPHNVRIDGKELGEQAQGASVTWKAEKAGTYPYTCTIHPSMSGTIVVK